MKVILITGSLLVFVALVEVCGAGFLLQSVKVCVFVWMSVCLDECLCFCVFVWMSVYVFVCLFG